jgi:hypothetical protein
MVAGSGWARRLFVPRLRLRGIHPFLTNPNLCGPTLVGGARSTEGETTR